MNKKGHKPAKKQYPTISFRISSDVYSELDQLAPEEKDEMGAPMNAHTLARKLLIKGLEVYRRERKK